MSQPPGSSLRGCSRRVVVSQARGVLPLGDQAHDIDVVVSFEIPEGQRKADDSPGAQTFDTQRVAEQGRTDRGVARHSVERLAHCRNETHGDDFPSLPAIVAKLDTPVFTDARP